MNADDRNQRDRETFSIVAADMEIHSELGNGTNTNALFLICVNLRHLRLAILQPQMNADERR